MNLNSNINEEIYKTGMSEKQFNDFKNALQQDGDESEKV